MEFQANFRISNPKIDADFGTIQTVGGSGGGVAGKDGASAYEIAVKNGFKGTETEWLESLHGDTPVRGVDYWTKADKDAIIDEVLNEIPGGGGSDSELEARVTELEEQVGNLLYKEIKITSFGHNAGTQEMGAEVTSVKLTWALNKTAKTLTLDGESLNVSETSKSFTGLSITKENGKTWKLAATDERGTKAEASTSISFLNGVYYGAAAQPASIDSAFILSLTKKLASGKVASFTANAGANQYIWYCLPVRSPFGKCTFKVGGFEGGFALATAEPIQFENASGYTEPYYVYRSDEINLGNTSVGVS